MAGAFVCNAYLVGPQPGGIAVVFPPSRSSASAKRHWPRRWRIFTRKTDISGSRQPSRHSTLCRRAGGCGGVGAALSGNYLQDMKIIVEFGGTLTAQWRLDRAVYSRKYKETIPNISWRRYAIKVCYKYISDCFYYYN